MSERLIQVAPVAVPYARGKASGTAPVATIYSVGVTPYAILFASTAPKLAGHCPNDAWYERRRPLSLEISRKVRHSDARCGGVAKARNAQLQTGEEKKRTRPGLDK
ncbi:hypothetical protein MRX96_012772 [Rhipicephalus microplus]